MFHAITQRQIYVLFRQHIQAYTQLGCSHAYLYYLMDHSNINQEDNIDLDESERMNEDQQAIFLNIQRSRSADSLLGKMLPQPNQIADRSLVFAWDPSHTLLPNHLLVRDSKEKTSSGAAQNSDAIRIFKTVKKQRVKSKCDYEKNICGYITKKIIREFVSKNYEKEVGQLVKKYRCSYAECKGYYLKKVELVTGPSHLPDLFTASPQESEGIANCKKAFKQFYRWFLKERYLRYLLLEGKMSDKLAYIEYKNHHLFKYVKEDPEDDMHLLETRIKTRSRSAVKLEHDELE